MKYQIDDIDKKILSHLVKNARVPFLEIARECGISGAAIHQRVKKMEESGVIRGFRLEVDPRALGYNVSAMIGIRISDPMKNIEIIEGLRKIPEVVECHFVTGKYNIWTRVYCVDHEHLMHTILDHILRVPGISETETFISLSDSFGRQVRVRKEGDE